jgi:hypothetical protein
MPLWKCLECDVAGEIEAAKRNVSYFIAFISTVVYIHFPFLRRLDTWPMSKDESRHGVAPLDWC